MTVAKPVRYDAVAQCTPGEISPSETVLTLGPVATARRLVQARVQAAGGQHATACFRRMARHDRPARRVEPGQVGRLFVLLLAGVWVIVLNNARIVDNVPDHVRYSWITLPRQVRLTEAALLLSVFVVVLPGLLRSRIKDIALLVCLLVATSLLAIWLAPTYLPAQFQGTYVYVAPFLVFAVAYQASVTRGLVRLLLWLYAGCLALSIAVGLLVQLPEAGGIKGDWVHGYFSDAHVLGSLVGIVCCTAFSAFLEEGGLGRLACAAMMLVVSYYPANEKVIIFTILWCTMALAWRVVTRPRGWRAWAAAGAAVLLALGVIASREGSSVPLLRFELMSGRRVLDVGPVRAWSLAFRAVSRSPVDLAIGLAPGNYAGLAAASAVQQRPSVLDALPRASQEVLLTKAGDGGALAWVTNTWSNVPAEFGIAGFIVFFVALGRLTIPIYRWNAPPGFDRRVRRLFFVAFAVIFWQGCFTPYTNWAEPVLVYPTMVLAAFCYRAAAAGGRARQDAARATAAHAAIDPRAEAETQDCSTRSEAWHVSVTDFPNGLGSTARARSLCRALAMAGYEPHLLIPHALGHGRNDSVEGARDGIQFEYLNGSPTRPPTAVGVGWAKLKGNLHLAGRMVRARHRLACVVVYNATPIDCWGTLIAGKWLRIPVILDLSDEWHDSSTPVQTLGLPRYLFKRFAKSTEGIVYRGVAQIIVVSRHLERRLARYAVKTVRCPMAFDPEAFAGAVPVRLAAADEFSIVYAGSVSRVEGVDILLDAFGKLRAASSEKTRLFVVGNPAHNETLRDYELAAKRLLLEAAVSFLPAVDHARYASLLRGADLLVIPRPTSVASVAGFPYKLAEYIASGSPVVVTRFGDVEEYFVDGRDCVICAPDSAGALANAMLDTMKAGRASAAMASSGQARVRELFGFEAVSRELGRVMKDLRRHGRS